MLKRKFDKEIFSFDFDIIRKTQRLDQANKNDSVIYTLTSMNLILLSLSNTLKQPRPPGSSISLSKPRAQRPTLPSTCDMSPGMLPTLWILCVLELILPLAFNVFLDDPRTVKKCAKFTITSLLCEESCCAKI